MPVDWLEHIVSTADILHGKPRIKGTRIPVSLILGYLAAGKSAEEIMAEYPDLTKEQIAACLDYARNQKVFEREPFDYTQWHQNLFAGLSVEEISRKAMQNYNQSHQSASQTDSKRDE